MSWSEDSGGSGSDGGTLHKQFGDNRLALQLFGAHHSHLARIEQHLDVNIHSRGNHLTIAGEPGAVTAASAVLDRLYARIERGHSLRLSDVDAALRMAPVKQTADTAPTSAEDEPEASVIIRGRTVITRTRTQGTYIRAIDRFDLVFGVGPAGTGKTYLAVAKAIERLVNGQVDRIILSRPAVEAGEQLGFLPGNMREKVDPYLRPLYDALYDMLPAPQVIKRLESGEIEVAPLAFMRGRTLGNAFVILDEAQNTTAVQMKMFLTRTRRERANGHYRRSEPGRPAERHPLGTAPGAGNTRRRRRHRLRGVLRRRRCPASASHSDRPRLRQGREPHAARRRI